MRSVALSSLLALLVLAAFAPTLDNGFVTLDDPAYVTANRQVLGGLSPGGVAWALTARHAANWHPLTWVSHMLDADLFGTSPRGHHFSSLLLHAAATAGLFLFLAAAGGRAAPAFFAAALFGLHPLRVESVAWVSERKDVLAALFWMLALLAWLRYARRPTAPRFLLAAAVYALGLGAKGTLLPLPGVLLALDLWPLGRRGGGPGATPWRTLLGEKALLALPALATLAVTVQAQRAAGTITSLSLPARLANAPANLLEYVRGIAWPADLFIPHLLPEGGAAPAAVAGGLAALALGTAVAWLRRRRAPWLAAGWTWFLLALVPLIGLVQFVNQATADRYTYLASAGLAVAAAFAAASLPPRLARRGAVVGVAVVVLLVPMTRAQSRHWRDDAALFGHAAALDPDNVAAGVNLGTALMNAGRYGEAERALRAILARHPGFVPGRVRLAGVLLELGRPAEAARELEPVVAREPLNVDARVRIGLALARSNRAAEALRHLGVALRLRPGDPEAAAALAELRGTPEPSGYSSAPSPP